MLWAVVGMNQVYGQTPELVIRYTFDDENGSIVENFGSYLPGDDWTVVTMYYMSDTAENMRGGSGSGVSEDTEDFAFHQGQAADIQMGNNGPFAIRGDDPGKQNAENIDVLDELTSFTLTGWYRTDSGAELIRAWFISHGIHPNRLKAYGEQDLSRLPVTARNHSQGRNGQ